MGLYNPSNVVVTPSKSELTTFQQLDDSDAVENLQLSSENTIRHQAIVFNDGNHPVFLALNNTATKFIFTVKIMPNGAYITPEGYTGPIKMASEHPYSILFNEFSYY